MTPNLTKALVTRLTVSNRLDSDDIQAIQRLRIQEKALGAREIIVADGERSDKCCMISEGFVFRSKTTEEGLRQVLSIHIAGEMPDLQSLHLGVMDHDLITVTPCVLGFVSHADMKDLTRERPNLAAALWRETLIDAAIFREWIINVGRREAIPRMAHLLIELHKRLETIGHTRDGEFGLPLTQVDLGDCLGLSTVHVNRVLQFLRKEGLIAVRRSEFHILQHRRLEELGQFDPAYLHLGPNA